MIITKTITNTPNNPDKLEQIEYLDLNLETKKEFDNLYRTLCKDENFQGFINTGIYGKKGNIRFAIYKDTKENNKICIAFIEKNKKYIICMDSNEKAYQQISDNESKNNVDIKKYIDGCCYYSITENEKLKHRETTGLNKLSKKNYKFSWMYYNKKYQMQLSEEKNSYKYEIKVMQNSGNITITCIWDKYEDFDNEIEPKIVTLKTCEKETIVGTYKAIESMAYNLGISLKNDSIRKYLKTGEYIDPIVPIILYDFYEIEKYKSKRNQITQYINEKEVPKVHYGQDAIQETRYLSKRYSIERKITRP